MCDPDFIRISLGSAHPCQTHPSPLASITSPPPALVLASADKSAGSGLESSRPGPRRRSHSVALISGLMLRVSDWTKPGAPPYSWLQSQERRETHTHTQTHAHACTPSGPDSLLMLLWPCSGGFHASSAMLTPRSGPVLKSQNKKKEGGLLWLFKLNKRATRGASLPVSYWLCVGKQNGSKAAKNPTSPKF